ncbi:MAG TPA: hypothetical protein VF753_00095 [Terriglobales bacterium]
MKSKHIVCPQFLSAIAVVLLGCFFATQNLAAQTSPAPTKGPGKIVVRPQFGGQIGLYDIDASGDEGVFAEQKTLKNGDTLSAVETFSQTTGEIVKVIRKGITQFDDDVVLGVVGNSTAIVLHEHATNSGVVRTYNLISPLTANEYTGVWQPPDFDSKDIFLGVSRNQGFTNAAFFFLDNIYPGATNFAFSEDVAKNSFGKQYAMTDRDFEPFLEPAFAYDVNTNTGVLANDGGCEICVPKIGMVNLATGKFSHFTGVGKGAVLAIAVDSDDGIAATTTSFDGNIEFYDLKARTGFAQPLPGATGEPQAGFDVEYDAIHKLFLVFQGDGPGEHTFIQVYDPKGNLVDSIDFGPFNRYGGYIALHPSDRSGFIGEGAVLRSFTY